MLKSYYCITWKLNNEIKLFQNSINDPMYELLGKFLMNKSSTKQSKSAKFQNLESSRPDANTSESVALAMTSLEQKTEQGKLLNNPLPVPPSVAPYQEQYVCSSAPTGKIEGVQDLRLTSGLCIGAFLGCKRTRKDCQKIKKNLHKCSHVIAEKIDLSDKALLNEKKKEYDLDRKRELAARTRMLERGQKEKSSRAEVKVPTATPKVMVSSVAKRPVLVKEERRPKQHNPTRTTNGNGPSNVIEDDDLIYNPVRPDDEKIVAQCGHQTLQAQSLGTLRDGCWLNDEMVNYWLARLQRNEVGSQIHIMPTQFMTKLLQQSFREEEPSMSNYHYKGVKSWLKVDLFSLDKFVVPINVMNNHWILACIFVQKETIQIFNSIEPSTEKEKNRHDTFLQALREYVRDEHDKLPRRFPLTNISQWTLIVDDPKAPRQENSFDCGIFCCMFSEYLCGKRAFDFAQNDATSHRRLMRDTIETIIATGETIN